MSTPSAPSEQTGTSGIGAKAEAAREMIQDRMHEMKQRADSAMRSARQRIPHIGHQNVADSERFGSVVSGALLALYGLRRGGMTGVLSAAAGAALMYRGATGHCSMYQQLGINTAGPSVRGASLVGNDAICVEKTILINKSSEELYRFWRNFENLPQIMRHLKSVTATDGKRSHWIAKGPAGTTVEWDAEIINEHENELIAWRSLEQADVKSAGSVRFSSDKLGRGTWVKVSLQYLPPAGKLGALVARLFGEEPHQQIDEDLARFKSFMETGEVPDSGAGSGREAM